MKGNKRIVIAIAVVASALWLALVAYVLIDDRHPGYYVKPGEVVVHAPSPAASSVPAIRTGASHTSPMLFSHHGGATAVNPSAYSFVSFSPETSSGSSMKMFETSSASVHNIGGGGSGGGSGMSGTGGSSNGQGRGIYSSALASGGAIHVAIPSLLISEPGATSAPAMASVVTEEGPRAMPRARKVEDDPFDPMLDPIGDVTWGLMLLLTIGWCVRVHRKRQQACR